MPSPFPVSLIGRKAQAATNSLLYNLQRLSVSRVPLGGTMAGSAIHAVSAPELPCRWPTTGCLLAAFAFAQNQVKLRVRFSLNNLKLDDDVLNIPLFQADQADRLIRQALRIRGQAGVESK